MRLHPVQFASAKPGFLAALKAAEVLHGAGFKAGLVGGSVRDLLLGRVPDDFDLVTDARPEELTPLFAEVKTVGASFGVSLATVDGISLEIATAREERNYLDGRHPESVRYTDSLEHDMLRRDFTVNALWYDPRLGAVADVTGGVDDLEQGILRTVGVPHDRFAEDYLRMLRAVRFAARLGFRLDPATFRAIRELAPRCAELSAERVREELNRMLTGPDPERAMLLLQETGLLDVLLPEVAALIGVTQPPEFHPEGDVWVHTLLMLRHMAAPDLRLAWSVLLHDLGKPVTRTVDDTGRIRFSGHEVAGEEPAKQLLDRLRFANDDRDAILHAIRQHMRFAAVRDMREGKLRRLLAEPGFSTELELHRLDCLACHGFLEGFVFLLDKLNEYKGRLDPEPPLITGRDLIAAGFTPGPAFKPLLDDLYERQLAGELQSREEALKALRAYL